MLEGELGTEWPNLKERFHYINLRVKSEGKVTSECEFLWGLTVAFTTSLGILSSVLCGL